MFLHDIAILSTLGVVVHKTKARIFDHLDLKRVMFSSEVMMTYQLIDDL